MLSLTRIRNQTHAQGALSALEQVGNSPAASAILASDSSHNSAQHKHLEAEVSMKFQAQAEPSFTNQSSNIGNRSIVIKTGVVGLFSTLHHEGPYIRGKTTTNAGSSAVVKAGAWLARAGRRVTLDWTGLISET